MEIIIFLSILFLGLYYFQKKMMPKIIGSNGERIVARRLKHLNKSEYIVLSNILIENSFNNYTSQIDHIVISRNCIFVIETKNYNGWIHGHQNSEYWTQTIYKHKNKFRNPIKQNWSHVYAIKSILSEYEPIKYFPVVVFSGSAEIKNVTSTLPVIYLSQINRIIKGSNINIGVSNSLSYNEMSEIADILRKEDITSRKNNRRHIKEINKRIKERKSNLCPKCNEKLILRRGGYGDFLGCPNFPKCRYILKIN